MHLERARSSYKGKTYTSYRIARSIRNGNKVEKEGLFPLGALSDQQANQIKLILHTINRPDDVLVALDSVVPTKALDYLDVAVANHIYEAIPGMRVNLCTSECLSPTWIATIQVKSIERDYWRFCRSRGSLRP